MVGVNWIGDAVMSMPALQAWRRVNPGTRLLLLTKSPLAPLWMLHRAPDEILLYGDSISSIGCAAREIAKRGISRAVIMPNSFRAALPPFLARVPERVGRAGHWRRWLLTSVAPDPAPGHQSLEAYDLLGLARPPTGPETPALHVPEEAMVSARRTVGRLARPLLAVMPGAARGPSKRWPALSFGRVASRWHAETGGGVVALGSAADRECCDQATIGIEESLNLAGQTSLLEWVALLAVCDAVVCNDSGGMHVAAALGRPVVAVFGATDPAVTGPIGPLVRVVTDDGPRSRDIGRRDRDAEKRLAALPPSRVYAALRELVP
ncbi:MAG: lipopolysaccharide heptosyltransferase II [Kiritimatiellae bacterium]|nr:lipopolysaccharide heptosyltransferase II [Kiritimatiellia bacterium]MDW8459192.1 lipopolysaccharide heptosyltransferase II [Verrucomicrobiota bacterium]